MNNQFFRQLPKSRIRLLLTRVFPDAKNPRQNPDDIAVKDRRRLVERNAANRAGGVTPDSRQSDHGIEVIRKFAAVFLHDLPRRLLQVAGAGVIAEALPKLVDFVRTRIGGGLDGGQFAHPAFPIRHDRLDLGLLEHDFGDPDGVGIAGAPPRQVAGVLRKPIQQF